MSARDILYGRRGGGWVPDGVDPTKLGAELREVTAAHHGRLAAEQAERDRCPSLFDAEPS